MPFHDLNVVYSDNDAELSCTLSFLHELGYSIAALAISIPDQLPKQLPQITTSRLDVPANLQLLTRLTLTLSDTSQIPRVSNLVPVYDLLALRPTNDKVFQLCCNSLECDIISFDFTQRLLFPFKFKTAASALQRGIRFEVCYSPGVTGSSDARRNLISGAASLIRATRGRGIIFSSEARNALGLRGPHDVVNLAVVWGLKNERGKEAICEEAGRVMRLAQMKRTSFRGVVDIVDDGTKEVESTAGKASDSYKDLQPVRKDPPTPTLELKQVTVVPEKPSKADKAKRKASQVSVNEQRGEILTDENVNPLSKRAMKRQAKKARLDRAAGNDGTSDQKNKPTTKQDGFPIQHEALAKKNG